VQGSLGGEYIRQSLDLTVWGAAQELVRGWEASGQVGVVLQDIPTVREAVDKHIADAEARNLKPESLKKVRDVVRGDSSTTAATKAAATSASWMLMRSASSGTGSCGTTRRILLGSVTSTRGAFFAFAINQAGSPRIRLHW
jgi:hypothetical protein